MNNYRIQNVAEDPITNLDNALTHINKILRLSGSDSLIGVNAEMAIRCILLAKKDIKTMITTSQEEMYK